MRRAGRNPTDVEVLDIINKIDDDSGCLNFKVPYNLFLQLCRSFALSSPTCTTTRTWRGVTKRLLGCLARMRRAVFQQKRSSKLFSNTPKNLLFFRFVLMHLPGLKIKVLIPKNLWQKYLTGDWGDDCHCWQEPGWKDQLLWVQGKTN